MAIQSGLITSIHKLAQRKATSCNHGRRKRGIGGQGPLRILKLLVKNVVFFSLSGKKQFFQQFWPSLEKFWKNPLVTPWKKSSEAHGCNYF